MTAVTLAIPSDIELVYAFVRRNDHDAFASLVGRHADMVYATALRRVRGDRHMADDVTQATFIILARRAHAFDERTLVAGWLHRAAGYAASNALKIESRRRDHERRAAENAMTSVNETKSSDDRWADVEPLLDAAVDRLGDSDRAAVVMRFHQDKSIEETATALGVSAEAAKKRLQRALAKLRSILTGKGVHVPTTAALATTIASHAAAVTAPAPLVDRAIASALADAASVAAAVCTPLLIAKGALTMMLWTKIKFAALAGAFVILLAGAGALAVSYSTSASSEQIAPHVPPPRYVFGDVVERVVNDDGLRKDECFDFDTGKLHTGPARSFASREEGRKWFRSTGADVHGETEEGETGLFGVELAILPVDNQSWDAGDAEELREIIADGPGATPLMSGDGDLPQTYLFRTREGGVGVCQILEVKRDEQQHGTIRIRYKLIKSAQ